MRKGKILSLLLFFDEARLRALLFQGEMGSLHVVVGEMGTEEALQVAVVEYDDMIEALTTNRANLSLNGGVLPG